MNVSLNALRRSAFPATACALLSCVAACGGSGNDAGQMGGSVQSIQISPASPEAAIGQILQLTATASYSNGTRGDVTGQVNWSSSNNTVATSSSSGQVDAKSAGFAVIHASLSGVKAPTQLPVACRGGGLRPGA